MLSTLGGNTVRVFDATLFENLPEKKNRLARTRTPSKVNTCVCVFAWQIPRHWKHLRIAFGTL